MQDMLLKISLLLKKSLKKCTFPSLALSTDLTLLKKGLFCQTTIAQGTERRGNFLQLAQTLLEERNLIDVIAAPTAAYSGQYIL